jgi:hypothetical protein
MNKKQKIRNEEAGMIAVDFSQRTEDANYFWLQPDIITMWLKPVSLFSALPLAEANGNIEFSTVLNVTISLTNEKHGRRTEVERKEPEVVKPKVINNNKFQ